MTELDTDKLINDANEDEIACMLLNIYTYADMDDYTHYANNTKEDLEWEQECGFILDITPGAYNGSLDKTDYSELTTKNIYNVLLEEVYEDGFQELLEEVYEEPNASEARRVRLLTEFYNVFTIGKHLYVDYD